MTPCIEWDKSTNKRGCGYGNAHLNRKRILAHRLAWINAHGPIPKGMVVCHKCDNPRCVNTEHLWIGTQKENIRDCWAKGRHPSYRGENNNSAKITKEDSKNIRHLYFAERRTLREVGDFYGLSQSMVSRICRRLNWENV